MLAVSISNELLTFDEVLPIHQVPSLNMTSSPRDHAAFFEYQTLHCIFDAFPENTYSP